MCGIAGAFSSHPQDTQEALARQARDMGDVLAHRGPDARGEWVDETAGIALAHRRLAVVDLSPSGQQPMSAADGRYVLVFNGEIYNHAALRRQLESVGTRFRGTSDTEVLLEACAQWGVQQACREAIGMFAFALWDRRERTLQLVRDRLGIKPLYVGRFGSTLLFGSELTALAAHPAFDAEIDRGALAALLRRNCVPSPHSINVGVTKQPPGTIVTHRADTAPTTTVYWSLEQIVRSGSAQRRRPRDPRTAVDELDALLREAVSTRMLADVPVGAFLSGGVDSSTVVALMQAVGTRPVRTFSIGSPVETYDEAVHARAVARHLGTDHTELIVRPDDVIDRIPAMLSETDEPFADSSLIPTRVVSELARQQVTVALSGDGGDELFAGYTRHLISGSRTGQVLGLPLNLRRGAARFLQGIPPRYWDSAARVIPARRRPPTAGDMMHKAARVLACPDLDALHSQLTSHWTDPSAVILGAAESPSWPNPPAFADWLPDATERMLYRDTRGYLPDDILTKVDRASMIVSLEARVPILDHRIAEFAWRLPMDLKVRDGRGKWVLRQVLDRYVPRELIDRPKHGFGIPIDRWLRGPLREWAEELLDPRRLRDEGYFHAEPIRQRWDEHQAGRRNWQHHLWDVLSFQAWLEGRQKRETAGHTRL